MASSWHGKTPPCVKRWAGIRLIKTNVIKFEIPDEDGSKQRKAGDMLVVIPNHRPYPIKRSLLRKRSEMKKRRTGALHLFGLSRTEMSSEVSFSLHLGDQVNLRHRVDA